MERFCNCCDTAERSTGGGEAGLDVGEDVGGYGNGKEVGCLVGDDYGVGGERSEDRRKGIAREAGGGEGNGGRD